jgi:hypothetical protein
MFACTASPVRGAHKIGSVGLPLPDVEGPAALPPGQVGRRVALDDPTPGRRLEPILGLT